MTHLSHPSQQVPEPGDPPGASPEEVARQLLETNPRHALRGVTCSLHDGVLVLEGCLPSYYLKQLAQEAVAGVPGVQRMENRIQVVHPPRARNPGKEVSPRAEDG